jgi:hypothetical protein
MFSLVDGMDGGSGAAWLRENIDNLAAPVSSETLPGC